MEPEFTSMHANTSKPIFIILQRLLIQMNHHPNDKREKTENCLYRYSLQPPPTPTQHLHTEAKKTPSAIFLVITTVVSYSYEQTHVIFPKAT